MDQPLIGVKDINGTYNTILPQQDNLAEIGGTWLPSKEIVCNATLGVEQAHTSIPNPGTPPPNLPINFIENSYPYSLSLSYTPTAKWTVTGGYANYTDFISQLITLGDDYTYPGGPGGLVLPVQSRWGYLGEAEVFDLGSTYRWTKDVKLTGAVQYTHGIDTITTVGSAAALSGLDFDSHLLPRDRRYRAGTGGGRLARPRTPGHVLPLPVLQFQRPDPTLQHRHRQRLLGRFQLGPLKRLGGRFFTTPK